MDVGVKTIIDSTQVGAGTGSGAVSATCPAGHVAVGGGGHMSGRIEPSGAESPGVEYLVASAPLLKGGEHIVSQADGRHGAAYGWRAEGRNVDGESEKTLKVAVVCAKAVDAVTVIGSFEVGAGQTYGAELVHCPSGFIAPSGGIQSEWKVRAPYVLGSSPVFPDDVELKDLEPSASRGAPIAWKGEVENQSGNGARRVKVAVVCLPG